MDVAEYAPDNRHLHLFFSIYGDIFYGNSTLDYLQTWTARVSVPDGAL
jgi:hypothetical protein